MKLLKQNKLFVFLFFLLVYNINFLFASFADNETTESKKQEISTLEYSDPQIISLRKEITLNIKAVKAKENIQVFWRTYTIKKDDNFFLIMAKTMQNQDTLASVNNLASLWDISVGQTLLIPNARGIAVYGNKNDLAEKYNVSTTQIFTVPDGKAETLFFIPGKVFSASERNYFNLSIFIRPVEGRVSSPYGFRKDPFTNKKRFHKGVDIACVTGSKVKAAASGKVVATGERSDYGKYIIIRHQNNYVTLYGHLSRIKTKSGNFVRQGEVIGLSGSTGRSTGPHLHFEVRKGGKTTLPRFRHE